ncbi:MAG: alanine dehydrogenase [Saprospiraceae bacterium]|nr:alanine dehydrogenase [Saprospiraceae bacterium]
MGGPTKLTYADFFTKGQFETLPETLAMPERRHQFVIGIPKETRLVENRVAIVPNSVQSLTAAGIQVKIESGAGEKSNFSDHDYSEAGAEICHDKKDVFQSNIIVKIAPPSVEEIELMQVDQVLISPLHLPIIDAPYLEKLLSKRITSLAMEYLQSADGTFPIVRIMSEIAGMSVMLTAGELLKSHNGSRGILLGGVSGVPPAKVVILGAGVVGEYAVKTALGLGASVRIFDNDISKIIRLQTNVGRPLHTSAINPVYLAHQLTSADVVIGAIHSKDGRAPIIITEEMVTKMKEGSILIDVSIDQGGCFETSEVTTLEKPTFVKHGVIHYCVPNIPSQVSRTASNAISNITTPLLMKIVDSHSMENLLMMHDGIRNGCYTYKGCLTNEYLSRRFSKKYTNLSLLLTSVI